MTKKIWVVWMFYFLSGAMLFLIALLFHNQEFTDVMEAFDKYGLVVFFSSALGVFVLFQMLMFGIAAGVFALFFQMTGRILMDTYMNNSYSKVVEK